MGSIVRHIDDIIEEYGSWEAYEESLKLNQKEEMKPTTKTKKMISELASLQPGDKAFLEVQVLQGESPEGCLLASLQSGDVVANNLGVTMVRTLKPGESYADEDQS